MKYNLKSTSNFYNKNKIKEIKKLEKLGFKFAESDESGYNKDFCKENNFLYKIKDGDDIEFKTLEDLFRFTEEYGEIVLHKQQLEIYDDYRE